MKPERKEAIDLGELPALMEPLLVPPSAPQAGELSELAFELTRKSTALDCSVPAGLAAPLSGLVRGMNCYYSNLIEGHDTHPIEIERALSDEVATDRVQRNLQIEARAHIEVQRWIDEGGLQGAAFTQDHLQEIHRRFCEKLPEDLLWVENPVTGEKSRVAAGAYRSTDVRVGRHEAISAGAVPRILQRLEQAYSGLGSAAMILAAAAAHHRFLWVHPFLDGNGRVARLMSHAMLMKALDARGIWSIARGLARSADTYKSHLAACDLRRRNDLDGRGNLSQEALAEFTRFFLKTCIDQVSFMAGLVQPGKLRERVMIWAAEEVRAGVLPVRSPELMEIILIRGTVPRGDVPGFLHTGERNARRVVSALIDAGALSSPSSRAPLEISFSARLAPRWLPGLFPDYPD